MGVTTTAVRPQVGALASVPAALRVRQWTKNLLVLAPLLPAADTVGLDEVAGAGIAFAMFCLLSSAVYLVNDVIDVPVDRLHPVKRHRPVAAGAMAPHAALVLAGVLGAGALALALVGGPQLLAVAAAYLVVQMAYCLWLKREPVLELAAVGSGFLLRALAGGVGAGIALSSWFLLAAGFGSLFVAAGKRYGEAVRGSRDAVEVRAVVQGLQRHLPAVRVDLGRVARRGDLRAVGVPDAGSQRVLVGDGLDRAVRARPAAVRGQRRRRTGRGARGGRARGPDAAAARSGVGGHPGGRDAGMSRPQVGEALRFAVVGLAAYGTDLLVFNLLLLAAGVPSVPAKVVAAAAAIAVAFAGSRWWTWRHRRGPRIGREYVLFLLASVLAAGIQVACLLASRELLGLRTPLADNVSANVVGMALATAFRFWAFRTVVFPERPESAQRQQADAGGRGDAAGASQREPAEQRRRDVAQRAHDPAQRRRRPDRLAAALERLHRPPRHGVRVGRRAARPAGPRSSCERTKPGRTTSTRTPSGRSASRSPV